MTKKKEKQTLCLFHLFHFFPQFSYFFGFLCVDDEERAYQMVELVDSVHMYFYV